MSDISQSLYLKIAVAGAGEAVTEVDLLSESLVKLGTTTDAVGKKASGGGLLKFLGSFKTLASAYGVYKIVKTYSDFNAQMARIQTQAGGTTAELGKQKTAIMQNAVALGTTPGGLATAAYHFESAGIRGKNAINGWTDAAKLAAIGGSNLEDTTQALIATMVNYGKSQKDATKYAAEMNATVGAGDMTMEQLVEAYGTGLPGTMRAWGVSIHSVNAALADLGDAGMKGASAATRLRMALAQVIKPTAAGQGVLKAWGLDPYTLSNDLNKPDGILAMVKQVRAAIQSAGEIGANGKVNAEGRDQLGVIFGGGRNSAALLTLLDTTTRLGTKYTQITKGERDWGKAWKETQGTLSYSLHQLEAIGGVLAIKLGPPLAWAISLVTHFLSALAMGHGVMGVARDALLGLAAGWALIVAKQKLWALYATIVKGIMGTEIGATIAATWALNEYTGAWGLATFAVESSAYAMTAAIDSIPIIGWIALAVSALIFLAFHWRQVKAAMVAVFDWGKSHLPLLLLALAPLTGGLTLIPLLIMEIIKHARALWSFISSGAKIAGRDVEHFLVTEWKGLLKVIDAVEKKAKSVFNFATGKGGTLSKIFSYGTGIGEAKWGFDKLKGFLAGGGTNVPGGTYVVGERGPEIMNVPGGSSVYSNGSMVTQGILGGRESTQAQLNATIPVTLEVDGRVFAQALIRESVIAQSRN